MSAFQSFLKEIEVNGETFKYYDVSKIDEAKYCRLPYSIRVIFESAVRNCDEFQVTSKDVANILDWSKTRNDEVEIPFLPSRVILQDFTGVPAVVDFAAMRDAVKKLGGDPQKINPICPADLVIDHSIQVDIAKSADALEKNQALEFERNHERFQFLKWGAKAFKNMIIVPPGSGIVHQVNLECLARVVFNEAKLLYPDSLVGTDSHTTMINGLGIVGWGVGGIEAEAVMLGQAISMVLPQVVGYKITGKLSEMCTSTDVVLTITKHLRSIGVVNKFVEFFGPGVAQLSIADRATIANMCPEYGATIGYFAADHKAIEYLIQTGRDPKTVQYIEAYLKAVNMFQDYSVVDSDPEFSTIVELDLVTVMPCVSGPKRPQDKIVVTELKQGFRESLTNKIGFNGYGLKNQAEEKRVPFTYENKEYSLGHGSVVIASITSCTNTSNPSVMLAAGLLAKKAWDFGLKIAPYIKTSLSPGSGVVTEYLNKSGMLPCLEKLGFNIVGYGCMTCIGNSGPLPEPISTTIENNDLVAVGILSGNRNFEGRIHPSTRANYLASPPLVIVYAIAGRIDIDFETEPIGYSEVAKRDIYMKDIWPSRKEIQDLETKYVIPEMFSKVYNKITEGNAQWNSLSVPESALYPWDAASTYIARPPFFETMTKDLIPLKSLENARALLYLGDSITTDHISPAGSIARNSPAAKYLTEKGLAPRDFNSYGSRRGNDAVMTRGTFANIRLVNKLMGTQLGPKTLHMPSEAILDIYEAAECYKKENVPVILLAGKEYGSGSSRDWAAKGPYILGVKAIIAESYERIHRSNLIGMGILPFQFLQGQTAESLGLTGKELFNIKIDQDLNVKQIQEVETDTGIKFQVLTRIDTNVELNYYKHGGILNYMIRKFL